MILTTNVRVAVIVTVIVVVFVAILAVVVGGGGDGGGLSFKCIISIVVGRITVNVAIIFNC